MLDHERRRLGVFVFLFLLVTVSVSRSYAGGGRSSTTSVCAASAGAASAPSSLGSSSAATSTRLHSSPPSRRDAKCRRGRSSPSPHDRGSPSISCGSGRCRTGTVTGPTSCRGRVRQPGPRAGRGPDRDPRDSLHPGCSFGRHAVVLRVMGIGGGVRRPGTSTCRCSSPSPVLAATTPTTGPCADHRVREGRTDSTGHPGRRLHHPPPDRRLGPSSHGRCDSTPSSTQNADAMPPGGQSRRGRCPGLAQWAYARSPSARPWRCSCTRTDHWRAVDPQPLGDPATSGAAVAYSFLLGPRAARFCRDRPAPVERNPSQSAPQLLGDQFSPWFAGRRVRGDRHRRAGAGGDHVDRRGEPVDPHVTRRSSTGCDPRPGGDQSKVVPFCCW